MCAGVVMQNETALCRRFTIFVTKYNLMSKDNLIVPNMDDQLEVNESEAWIFLDYWWQSVFVFFFILREQQRLNHVEGCKCINVYMHSTCYTGSSAHNFKDF